MNSGEGNIAMPTPRDPVEGIVRSEPRERPGLKARGISKRYGNTVALVDVDFEVAYGEIMGLVGANGAGKSTLVEILAGFESGDEGTVQIDAAPRERGRAAVAVAHQELSVVPTLSVAENLFLGDPREPRIRSRRSQSRASRRFLEMVGLDDLNPLTNVATLSLGQRQLLELARILVREASVVLVDEPTAALSGSEAVRVLSVLRDLADEGCAVVLVTHRIDEIRRVADRVTVLRDGRMAGPLNVAECSVDRIVTLMLGTRVETLFPVTEGEITGPTALELQGVRCQGLTQDVRLCVREGEILGLAGHVGSGAVELLETLAGIRPATSGAAVLRGNPLRLTGQRRRAARSGIGYSSAERKADGIFPMRRVVENLTAPGLRTLGLVGTNRERRVAGELASRWTLPPGRITSNIEVLSGGNQQKVVHGKWNSAHLRMLLLNEPTRGVDIGSRAEIYAHLRRLAADGVVVVFASSEIDEVIGVADQVVTFCGGAPVRTARRGEVTSADVLSDVVGGANG